MENQQPGTGVDSRTLTDFLRRIDQDVFARFPSHETVHRFSLHDLRINLLTQNDHYAELVLDKLVHSLPSDAPTREISIAVLSPDECNIPRPPVWGESTYHPRQFEQILDQTPWRASYFHDCRLWQIFNYRTQTGLQWMRGSRDYPAWESGAPLRVFLHWAFRFQNSRLAHAGTLGKNGNGVLLVGKGGSGKSATVIGGISHGLQSTGDDYIKLELVGETGVLARPVFRTLKQDGRGLDRLGLAGPIAGTRLPNWQGKYEFTSTAIGRSDLVRQLMIRALLVPAIGNAGRTVIRQIRKSRAMLALAPTGLFQLPGERDSGVCFFRDVIRRLPCYEVELGNDPFEISETIESFIDRQNHETAVNGYCSPV